MKKIWQKFIRFIEKYFKRKYIVIGVDSGLDYCGISVDRIYKNSPKLEVVELNLYKAKSASELADQIKAIYDKHSALTVYLDINGFGIAIKDCLEHIGINVSPIRMSSKVNNDIFIKFKQNYENNNIIFSNKCDWSRKSLVMDAINSMEYEISATGMLKAKFPKYVHTGLWSSIAYVNYAEI